jgi:Protein of unknown function (DUF4236)
MAWYLRKSVRMGPVRWNLSKSGIGMSAGVRGLRVGTGPRGSYIAGGRGGLYFRQRIGGPARGAQASQHQPFASSATQRRIVASPPSQPLSPASSAPMEYLPETDITQYAPATADALAQYIATQRGNIALYPWTLGLLIILNLAILGSVWPVAILTVPLSVYGAYYVFHWDRQRTHVVLHYDLDTQESRHFAHLCTSLTALASVARLQRVEARQVHGDWRLEAPGRCNNSA